MDKMNDYDYKENTTFIPTVRDGGVTEEEVIELIEEYIEQGGFVQDSGYTHIDVVDNHTSTSTTNALSANQGKVLYDLIDGNSHSIFDLTNNKQDKVIRTYEYTDITSSSYVNGWISNSGISSAAGYTTKFYPVVQGNTYKIKGKHTSGTSSYLYAYYNGDTHIVSLEKTTSETASQVHEMEITVPTEGTITHVAIEWNGASNPDLAYTYCKLKTQTGSYTIEDVKANVDTLNNTVSDLNDDVVDLNSKIYTHVETTLQWEARKFLDTPSVGSTPSFSTVSDYKCIYIQNLQVGDVVNAKFRAGSSAAKKYGAKVKNGLITKLISSVSPYEYTFECDGSFDALIFNQYTGWGWDSYAILVQNVLTTNVLSDEIDDLQETVNDIIEQGVGGEFNMLCFGNSFTQDTISYVPWLVKECEPNLKLNVYFTYMGGMPISQCLAYISNGTSIALNSEGNPSTKYENHGGYDTIYSYNNGEWVLYDEHKSYTLYKYDDGANFWVSQSEPTAAEVLAMKNWDLITIQQGGSFNYASWDYYFKPYVYKIQAELQKQVGHNFRFGYLMTHASYSNDYNTLTTRYNGVVQNATKMMENTPNEILLPYATALQNARTTYLNRFCPSRVYSATLKNGLVKTVNRTNQTTITCDGSFNEVIVNNYYNSSEPTGYIQNPSVLKNGTELTGWVNGSYSMYENSKPIFLNSDGTNYTSLYITGLVNGDVLTINAKNTLAGQNLLGDTAHVNEGVGVLTCAYANTMAVLDMIGSKKTVVGSQIFPDASWVSSHNIPAASTYILGLTPYNIYCCQQCAVMAYKYPLQLTDMVSKGMIGAIEITLDNLNVVSSNPMLSANSGDSWSTTLTGKTGYTITSIHVSMGGTDITSTAVSGSTITIDNVSDTVIINVSGTQV